MSFARRAGECAVCGTPFHVGEEISFVTRDGREYEEILCMGRKGNDDETPLERGVEGG